MPRVFLSHSSRDKKLVARLAEDLTAEGIDVWLDAGEILAGDSIAQEIQKGLEASDFIVLVLSRASVRSGWVDKEWQARIGREATSRAVHIIPVLAERCEIPALLADKRTADFTEDYDAGLGELLAAIRKHAGDDVEPRAAPARVRLSPYHARLVVAREDGAPVARWHAPDEGTKFPLALPLGAEDLEALRWYLETYVQFPGAGDRARAEGLEARLAQWGAALFDALFDNRDGGAVYKDLTTATENGRPVLLTLASDDAEVLSQPWELLRDKKGPLSFQGVSLRRQLRETGATEAPELDLPLRVLLIVSRPRDCRQAGLARHRLRSRGSAHRSGNS